MNKFAILKSVNKAFKNYGMDLNVYRDIYKPDELPGTQILVESKKSVGTIRALINNTGSVTKTYHNDNNMVVQIQGNDLMYIPYDPNINIKVNDYIIHEGCYYEIKSIIDVLHYNLLYECALKEVDKNE
ncbi:MAG: hypothetical protein RR623_08075 [Bacilli bacterium]